MPNPFKQLLHRVQHGGGMMADAPPVQEYVTPPPSMEAEQDPTAWLINSSWAEVILLHAHEVKLMAMFAYVLLHGYKLYPKLPQQCAVSFRFISLMLASTGGGIIVPILINSIPVTLLDSYPMAGFIPAFLIHEFFPLIREVISLSPILKITLITLYECNRAKVVCTLIKAATAAIPASEFKDLALFGPIFCGTIAGCGGAFLPWNKGLDPIKESGLQQPMFTALCAATCFHLFINTSLSDGVAKAADKAQLIMAFYFILHNVYTTFLASEASPAPTKVTAAKKKN
ncbi:hypothetical protein ACA910_006086 [Epithemia clementina (nom. ined.)]